MLYFAAAAQVCSQSVASSGATPRIYWHANSDFYSEIVSLVNFKIYKVKRHKVLGWIYSSPRPLRDRSILIRGFFKLIWKSLTVGKYCLPDTDFNEIEFQNRKNNNVLVVNYHQNFNLVSKALESWLKDFNDKSIEELQEFNLKLESTNPICVSMRFGDFLDPHVAAEQGNLEADYFLSALANLGEVPGSSRRTIWVFSDEPEKGASLLKNLGFSDLMLVRKLGLGPVKELQLMSFFNDLIICNSTYSWWAGYLCNEKSRVVAPDPLTRNRKSSPAKSPNWELVDAGYPPYTV
jgi:hypothetical protein